LMDKGKTVLASLIIETLLKEDNIPVLFFYCKHRQQEKSTFASILRGLLAQIIPKDATLVSWFAERCSSLDRQKLGLPEILEELARFAFNSQRISLVVLDGLDECNTEEIKKTISWFVSCQGANHTGTGQIRLMCIGQRIDILQTMLASATSISLDNSCHRDDIAKYVAGKTRNILEKFKIKPDTVSEISFRATKTAKGSILFYIRFKVYTSINLTAPPGMFLYAKLVMENLLRQRTEDDLMRELEPNNFPEGLDEAYVDTRSTALARELTSCD
jgi:hypothetical protein